ncbi:hypothetical protein PR048_014518 [Dryococelus australis]|uniref:GPI ethanolamine phosphate transferase 1 n=1 Tax=Dryococelus australis TaxID=614101 RepID=A0ABQ9HEE9_9NEOP|nr:hypothetical protein PR048_014518 [Dryococelus australis]
MFVWYVSGSHGAGEASETETPLVAWGAGISGPWLSSGLDGSSPAEWQLNHLRRRDVRQADIAPLMATLIGVPLPVNSVGFLPRSYLNLPERHIAEAVFTNARQISAQLDKKQETVEKNSVSFFYRPFHHLTRDGKLEFVSTISEHIDAGQYQEAIAESERLLLLSLSGLDYYQNYYQRLLLVCVSALFVAVIVWLLLLLLPRPQPSYSILLGGLLVNAMFASLLCCSAALIYGV